MNEALFPNVRNKICVQTVHQDLVQSAFLYSEIRSTL